MSAVWPVHLSLDDDWVDVLQGWIFDLFECGSDLQFFRVTFCTTFPPHDRVCIIEQLLKFGPVHVGWILTVVMQILNDVFSLENLRWTHPRALTMANQSWPLGPTTLQIHSNGFDCQQCVRMLGQWQLEANVDLFRIRFKGLSTESCH